jgi:hypothetical protein
MSAPAAASHYESPPSLGLNVPSTRMSSPATHIGGSDLSNIDYKIEELKKSDKAFARWFRKLPNQTTQRDYYGCFVRFLASLNLSPQQFLDLYKQGGDVRDDLIDRVEENLNKLKEIHFSLTVQTHAAFVSFLKHNGIILGAAAFEIPSPKRETINSAYIPNDEEFEALIRFARLCRDRFLLMFHRYGGSRVGAEIDPVPLILRHILDLDLEALDKGEITFKHETTCAIVIYASFKGNEIVRTPETYVTFLPPRAMQLLKEYLEERMRSGEKLMPESYLFRTYENGAEISFLTRQTADVTMARICRRAGYVIKYKD